MARPKSHKSHIRKLGRIGTKEHGSYYVTIPINLIRKFGWKDGQKLTVKENDSGGITIKSSEQEKQN